MVEDVTFRILQGTRFVGGVRGVVFINGVLLSLPRSECLVCRLGLPASRSDWESRMYTPLTPGVTPSLKTTDRLLDRHLQFHEGVCEGPGSVPTFFYMVGLRVRP